MICVFGVFEEVILFIVKKVVNVNAVEKLEILFVFAKRTFAISLTRVAELVKKALFVRLCCDSVSLSSLLLLYTSGGLLRCWLMKYFMYVYSVN